MYAQLRRGILDVCVLRSLRDGESYGYAIIRDLSPVVTISESTLYPILRRLEAAGCVASRYSEHNGRLRKYYEITQRGRDRISSFLSEWEDVMSAYVYIREGSK